jgi:hypothetical protein
MGSAEVEDRAVTAEQGREDVGVARDPPGSLRGDRGRSERPVQRRSRERVTELAGEGLVVDRDHGRGSVTTVIRERAAGQRVVRQVDQRVGTTLRDRPRVDEVRVVVAVVVVGERIECGDEGAAGFGVEHPLEVDHPAERPDRGWSGPSLAPPR